MLTPPAAAERGDFIFSDQPSATASRRWIGCLAILGISLYLGGWLYRKVGGLEESPCGSGPSMQGQ